MKRKLLGMATVLGAVIFFLSIVSLHLLDPVIDPIAVGLVGADFRQYEPLVLFGFAMLAVSLSAISFAVPHEFAGKPIGLSGRTLLNLAAAGLVLSTMPDSAEVEVGFIQSEAVGTLILGVAAVLLTSGLILLGAALDRKIRPDNSFRRFRVLALLATMTLLLFFLTWGRVSGLFQRVYLAVVSFWLVVAGLAAMDDWEVAAGPQSSRRKREQII